MASKTMAATIAALDGMNAAANGGTLRVYSGAVPADASAALGGAVEQGSFALDATAFDGATDGGSEATADLAGVPLNSTVSGPGDTVTFARLVESNGTTVVAQYTVGTAGAEIIFDDVAWVVGGNITLTGLVNTLAV